MRLYASVIAVALASTSPAFAGQVWLTMDQVRPFEIERPAGQIVVGNPAIADVRVQDKNRVLLFGKAPGLTNMYIFDEDGKTIDNLVVRVGASSPELLVVHRGVHRTTYNCARGCDATSTVGDSEASFGNVNQQVQMKFQQASTLGEN